VLLDTAFLIDLMDGDGDAIEKARELGCDESEAAFDKRLKRIAQAPPPATPKPKPKKRAPAK
jgi:hypothetical protein